jgi:rod shape-determining protein MreC
MAGTRERGPERIQGYLPAILLVASLLCLVISTRSLMGLPERVGLSILGFFQRGFSAVGSFIGDTATSISELKRLRADYDGLLEKTKTLDRLERDFADIRAENERLKEQLGVAPRPEYQRISARVIGKDPGNLYATLAIDKGVSEGIRKNMPVTAWQGGVEGLVGRVIEAGQGISLVVPLYDLSSYVASRLSKSRYEGLLVGQGSIDDPLVMKYVRKRARDEAQVGDLVVSSGLESIYPADLALGRVKRIRDLEYQPSLDIDVEPVLDFSRLEYVFVVKPAAGNAIRSDLPMSVGGVSR